MEQIYTQIRQYIDENRQPMLNLWRCRGSTRR